MIFVAFDGDNIGRKVGQAVLADDVEGLIAESQKIDAANEMFCLWAEQNGGRVISKGGDQGIFSIDESLLEQVEELRQKYQEITGMSCTIGVGGSLSESGKALMAGKLMGKDILLQYDEHIEQVLADAHEHAQSGHGDEEESKLDEQYLDHESPEMADDSEYQDEEEPSEYEEPSEEDSSEEDPSEYGDAEQSEDEPSEENFDEDSLDSPMEGEDKEKEGSEEPQELDQVNPQDDDHADPSYLENEQPIDIKESPEMAVEQDPEPLADDENEQPEGLDQEEPNHLDLLSSLMADSGNYDDVKAKVADVLEQFKAKRESILALKEQDPETYAAMMLMLKNMIDMAKQLAGQDQPSDQSEPVDNPDPTNPVVDQEVSPLPKT